MHENKDANAMKGFAIKRNDACNIFHPPEPLVPGHPFDFNGVHLALESAAEALDTPFAARIATVAFADVLPDAELLDFALAAAGLFF